MLYLEKGLRTWWSNFGKDFDHDVGVQFNPKLIVLPCQLTISPQPKCGEGCGVHMTRRCPLGHVVDFCLRQGSLRRFRLEITSRFFGSGTVIARFLLEPAL